MAHVPFAQDAWTRARDRFIEDLSEAERCLYHQSSLEMIFYDASAAQKHHQEASTSRHLMSKLQPFTSAIEQYGQALDVYVAAYPLVLSPLWGSLRVVLHLAREFGKYFEKLIDMFERIGDVLPRFRAYERLFPDNERLLQSLSVAYVDILRFCYDAKAVFRRSKRTPVATLKISLKLTWKPFDLQFGEHLRKFREHEKTVEKEAELSHMLESADTRAIILANQMQLQKEKRENDRIKFLTQLSAVSHVDLHKMQRQNHCSGTGLWALKAAEYIEWKSPGKSGGLCYQGIPHGSGMWEKCFGVGDSIQVWNKSKLISMSPRSTIIEDLFFEEERSGTLLVYYYCSFADPRSLVKSQILGNIMRQLIQKGAIPQEFQNELLETFLTDGRTPMDEKLIQEIRVFDGLDECKTETLQGITNFLVRLVENNPLGIRVLLTCREESNMTRLIHHWPRVQLDEASCAADIQAFIESSVRSSIESAQLKISSSSLEIEVVTTLATKAHGMFLWVHFQLIDLCAAISTMQIRATLKNLPDGLGETYDRILNSIGQTHTRAGIAAKVFQWLACARRPLQIEELQEAVAFDKSDKFWDSEKIPDPDLLLQSCKGLVIRDHHNSIVRFAHYTVQQYLFQSLRLEPQSSQNLDITEWIVGRSETAQWFRAQMPLAEKVVAKTCIAYLNFSDFETAIALRPSNVRFTNSGILGPGGAGSIANTVGIGKPVIDVIYKVLGGRARPTSLDVDFARYFHVKPRATDLIVTTKHALLNYIIGNWPWHVDACKGTDIVKKNGTLFNLVFNKHLPFEFRPWGPNRHFGPYGCSSCWTKLDGSISPTDLNMTSMMHWAAKEGLIVFFMLLTNLARFHIGAVPDFETSSTNVQKKRIHREHFLHERYSNETMVIACQNGSNEVFKYVADVGLQVGFPKHVASDSKLFTLACTLGHAEIVETLLDLKKSYSQAISSSSLFVAATNGHASVVNCLLRWKQDSGLELDVMYHDESTGLTALHSAATNGHEEIVRMLLNPPIYVDRRDKNSDSTALHYAANYGHTLTVLLLLSFGASVECRDRANTTPLLLAAKGGHLAVVKCLVDGGASIDSRDYDGMTPLQLAAKGGHVAVVKCLIECGAFIDSRDYDDMTPLLIAAKSGHLTVVKYLIEGGASAKDDGGTWTIDYPPARVSLSPLMWAAANGHTDMVDLLLDFDARIHRSVKPGLTAVLLAASNGHAKTLEKLFNRGAENSRGVMGWTGVHFAAQYGHDGCLEFFCIT